ncbi:MAG: MCE family protein [Syntrophales bacterium]|jgi:phospholipid/cholesterol/gamma-HCH transport system substrate-binding protein|nr:MCE family protein [Syntrophales bacterium]
MGTITTEAKVGLFILIAMLILGYMTLQVGQRGFGIKKGYIVDVAFDNVSGLNKYSAVQIAGVEVGRVEDILLKDGKALVRLRIIPGVTLEKDVTAAIKTRGVLGDKYIEIKPGTHGMATLEPGERIQNVERQADIDRLLNQIGAIADDIKTVSASLSNVLGGQAGEESIGGILQNMQMVTRNINQLVVSNEATIRSMLLNAQELTGNLNRVVVQNDAKVGEVIDNLRGASREMEKTFAAFNEIADGVNRGEGTLGQLMKDNTAAANLNKTLASLQEVSDKINQGKGTLGRLVNDEETVNNLNESLSGINRYVTKAEQFRTFLGYRGEYLWDKSNFKSYLDVKIQPKQDQFYLLGLVSDPRGRLTVRDYTAGGVTTTVEEWDKNGLLFNAQIGKRFRNVILRGGILESTGGFGLDYMAFNDRLKLTFEAFDFSSDRNAHLKGYADVQLFKYLYLTGGWDDFISNRGNSSGFVGLSIRFEDDDLKYLLTSTPIPK